MVDGKIQGISTVTQEGSQEAGGEDQRSKGGRKGGNPKEEGEVRTGGCTVGTENAIQ